MKVECLREHLHRAVLFAERVTGKKLPLQVLSRILLEVKGKELFIRANHLGNLRAQSAVTLETAGGNLLVSTPGSSAVITCESPEDFPELPRLGTGSTRILMGGPEFISGISSVAYAASPTDLKPELSAVFMRAEEKELIFTATDSFRLAEKRIGDKKVSSTEILDAGVLIPLRNAQEIVRVFGEVKESLSISLNKNQISFTANDIYVVSRLVEGNFPAYGHLIPKSFTTQAVVLKEDLIGGLRLTSVFADKFNQIELRIIPEDALFELHARNQESGESTMRVDATVEGESVNLSINSRYLADCFQSISKDSITIGCNGMGKAILVRPFWDRSFSYLVMPLHK